MKVILKLLENEEMCVWGKGEIMFLDKPLIAVFV